MFLSSSFRAARRIADEVLELEERRHDDEIDARFAAGTAGSGSNGLTGVWPAEWLSDKRTYYYLTLALVALARDGVVELDDTAPGAAWRSEYLYSRAATVYGGTQQIQRNIIADRVLALPKE